MTMPDMDAATKNAAGSTSDKPGRAPQDHQKSRCAARLDEATTVGELVRQAREDGDELTGPGG